VAWETRRPGGPRYYTRTRRAGRGWEREYLGTGPRAEAAAAADELRRAEQQVQAAARRQERDRHEAAQAPLRQLCDVTDLLVRAALLLAGYHRHARGQWRRRRVPVTSDCAE
jgi:hypothetical protein